MTGSSWRPTPLPPGLGRGLERRVLFELKCILQLTRGSLLGQHPGRVVVFYFEPERIDQEWLSVHLDGDRLGGLYHHTARLTHGLARPADVEEGQVHVVHGHDLHKIITGALGARLLFPRFCSSGVTFDVEEEESMRSVVLQPLGEVFSPPVLQFTPNPAAAENPSVLFHFPVTDKTSHLIKW